MITLTTDFGLEDSYVGQMKGVILSIAPEVRIVDLAHGIQSQNVLAGAISLEGAIGAFPEGTIHIGVIDPGVGSERAAIAIDTEHGIFIGPDNGLFSAVLEKSPFRRAVRLTNSRYHRPTVSRTFHGRDIFAPVAGHLAAGADFADLGEPTTELATLDIPRPAERPDGGLDLVPLCADRFGNLILNLTEAEFRQRLGDGDEAACGLYLGRKKIATINQTFADVPVGWVVAYFGGSGRLEVGIRNGDAAAMLKKHGRGGVKLTLRF